MNLRNVDWRNKEVLGLAGVIVLVALLLTNLWLVLQVRSLAHEVSMLKLQSGCSCSSVNLTPLQTALKEGLVSSDWELLSQEPGETLDVAVTFLLVELQPESQVIVRYCPKDGTDWSQIEAKPIAPLQFQAVLTLEADTDYQYQILQLHGDQIIKASGERWIVLSRVKGNPNVHISAVTYPKEGKTKMFFRQEPRPRITALQAKRIIVKLLANDTVLDSAELKLEYESVFHEFNTSTYKKADTATVTVIYGDGEERTVSFKTKQGRFPVIRRDIEQ